MVAALAYVSVPLLLKPRILGTGPGAGMALLYILSSLGLLLIGVGGYTFTGLRQVEKIVPDHDAIAVTFEDTD